MRSVAVQASKCCLARSAELAEREELQDCMGHRSVEFCDLKQLSLDELAVQRRRFYFMGL